MDNTDQDEEHIWHMSKSLHFFPVVAISAIYLVFGVVGNATVCFVSIVRMRRSVLNNFVLALATAELIGCMFTIPVEITQLLNIYSFDYPILCKFERYLRSFIVFFTSCTLIAIATERYQRIVKPHRKHVTSFQFRMTIACSFIISSIAALPEAIIAGTEVLLTDYGTGRTCSTYSSDQYVNTVFPSLWACFVVVIYVISTTAIGSIYCVIAVQIWKRGKLLTDRRSRPNTPDLTLKRRVDPIRMSCDDNYRVTTNQSGMCLNPMCSEDIQYRSRSHTSTMTRNEDPDEITPLPELRENPRSTHTQTKTPREPLSSLSDDADGGIHPKSRTSQNDDVISEASEGNRTPRERNSLFSEILSYFQSKSNNSVSRTNSTCTERSKFSFLEKRSSKEQGGSSIAECDGREAKEENNTGREGSRTLNQIDTEKYSDISTSNQQPKDSETQQQSRDVRRKLTAVFFDELAVTVDRRRRRATFSSYGGEESAASYDDLLSPTSASRNTPLSLSPMGSVRSRGGYSRKRTTFIMFIMTLTTVLSLLPHVIVMLYRLQHPYVESRLSPDNSVFFRVAWNSFFISLAAHPYVYGFWNGRFKKALLSLFDDVKKESRRGINRVRKASGFEFK